MSANSEIYTDADFEDDFWIVFDDAASDVWKQPWGVEVVVQGDGHWDNEFHVNAEAGEGMHLAAFQYNCHAELFTRLPTELRRVRAELGRLRAENERLRKAIEDLGTDLFEHHGARAARKAWRIVDTERP